MDMDMAGFVGIAALMIALVAWLRADMRGMERRLNERMDRIEARMDGIEAGQGELRERMARLEGMVDGLREAVVAAVRRDAA